MKFHDTWSFRCFHLPEIPWYVKYQTLKNHWNSTVHEITDVEIVAKLPDTRKLQHVYWSEFDDTFNFYAWSIEKVIPPFYSIDTSRYVSWLTLHFISSNAGVFRGASFSSLPINACSTENNIPFPLFYFRGKWPINSWAIKCWQAKRD